MLQVLSLGYLIKMKGSFVMWDVSTHKENRENRENEGYIYHITHNTGLKQRLWFYTAQTYTVKNTVLHKQLTIRYK